MFLKTPLFILCLTCITLLASSCGGKFGDITFTEESAEATVMGVQGGIINMLPTSNLLPPMNITINLSEELDSQNAGPAKAVYLDELSLEITDSSRPNGDVDNFDFIESVDVFVEPTQDGSSLEKKKIAELADVPEGQTTVDFKVIDDVDLKPYVEEGMRLVTQGSGEVPEDDTSLKAIVTIRAELL